MSNIRELSIIGSFVLAVTAQLFFDNAGSRMSLLNSMDSLYLANGEWNIVKKTPRPTLDWSFFSFISFVLACSSPLDCSVRFSLMRFSPFPMTIRFDVDSGTPWHVKLASGDCSHASQARTGSVPLGPNHLRQIQSCSG